MNSHPKCSKNFASRRHCLQLKCDLINFVTSKIITNEPRYIIFVQEI